MSREGQTADSASRSSLNKSSDSAAASSDHTGNAANVNDGYSNGSPKQKNLPMDPAPVIGLPPQGNGKENQDAESGKDISTAPHEASKSFTEDEKVEISVDKPDLRDPSVKSVSFDDSESDAMEQDVKVCDICGDTGREDLLAVCCRCLDGAEHTYCMREMLQEVSEGDWLCEECKYAEENAADKSGLGVEGKSSVKAQYILGKRPAEEIGVARSMKKQALEVNVGSPRAAGYSRSSSLNMDKGKGRAAHDFSEVSRSPKSSRIQVYKNNLLKSKSFSAFNAKPKAKQVEEGLPQRPRGACSHSLLDTKIGSLRALGKSASFKYVNRAGPDSPDSKVKVFPAKFCNSQELKGGSREKNEQNLTKRNRLPRINKDRPSATRSISTSYTPKLDRKPSFQSETRSVSSLSVNRDPNDIDSDDEPGPSLSKSASYVARRGMDGALGSAASSSSDSGCNISVKKRSNLAGPKGGMLSGFSWSSEKPCNNVSVNTQDGLSCARESRNYVEKTQESSAGRMKKAVTSGSSTADVSSYGSSQARQIDVSASKTVRVDMSYGSKSTIAVTSAMLKKPGRRNKALDKSDGSSVTNAPATQERSAFQETSKNSENATQLNGVNEVNHPLKDAAVESKWKPVLRELPTLWKASIIPEHECLWQGGFQVQRGSKRIDMYGGFQAHSATCTSPMVLEMVTKFSDKIALNEVPRLSTWPFQFRDYGTKEDHIALYFFARDIESYERNYRGLLDNMMKSDLALTGCLGSAELLIFPSNQLPEKSQRWNMSFYLWGVFKGSRANGFHHGVGEGEGSMNKQKTDNNGTSECYSHKDANLTRDNFARQVYDLNECSDAGENLTSEDCSNRVKPKGMEAAERCLFAVSSQGSEELKPKDSPKPVYSAEENQGRSHVPDLELALGAETKSPSKGVSSFWVDHHHQSKKPRSPETFSFKEDEEEDDRKASLSLSLSFSFRGNDE